MHWLALIVFVLITHFAINESRLVSVHIVQRHGLRAPVFLYPTYPYTDQIDTLFPRGLSQLTQGGLSQCADIGQYYANRYRNFYPKDSRNAILQASNVDRCLDSLAIVSNQLWRATHDRTWIAPRIYSAPGQLDFVVFYGAACPNADAASNAYYVGPVVTAFNQQNQWLYNIVGNQSGLPADGLTGLFTTLQVFDSLKATKKNGFAIPKWAVKYFDQMGNVMTKYFDFSYAPQNAIRIRIGSLLREISTRMDQAMNSNITVDRWYKDFFLYNTHDANIHGLTTALGNPQPIYPPYGAAVIFELHEIQNQNIVRVYYLNHTESLPISGVPLIIPSCGVFDCPYQTFISSISGYFPGDLEVECGLPDTYDPIFILQQNLTNPVH